METHYRTDKSPNFSLAIGVQTLVWQEVWQIIAYEKPADWAAFEGHKILWMLSN
jgi:hypothetical protein